MRIEHPSLTRAYGAAVLLPALALTSEYFLYAKIGGPPSPFLLAYPAVFCICWLGGRGPGLVATALSAAGAWYLFLQSQHSLAAPAIGDALKLGVFTIMGVLLSVLIPASQTRHKSLGHDFMTVLESTSDFIYFKDKDSRIRFCSQTMANLCGRADWRDMIGKHDREIFPAETARIYSEEEVPVFRDGKPLLNRVDPYFDQEGNRRWVSTSKWPVFSEDKKSVVGLFGISRDITEQKSMEEALRVRKAKMESIFRAAPVGIAELANRAITLANDRFCQTVGYSAEEVTGMPTRTLYLSDQDYERVGELFYAGSKEMATTSAEVQFRRKDGRVIDVLLTMTPIDPSAAKAGATFMVMDITEKKWAALELKRYADELAESNKMKDIFTDVLRHDILNPVNAIHLSTTVLARGETEPTKTKFLTNIARSVSNLTEMIENAAKLARLSAAKDIEFSLLDLDRVFRDVLDDFEPQLKERNVAIEFASGGESPAEVNAAVGDVFANLISNAIKYGPANSTLGIHIGDEGDSWVASVTNAGEGIPDRDKARIFHRFERLEKEGVKGSGLGLTIAAQIISLHSGKIWVEDNPKGGCIFRVRLPKKQKAAKPAAAHEVTRRELVG
jgi:PAS domain S-box-containing protein